MTERSKKDIKADLVSALLNAGDAAFAEMGFKRRGKTLNYDRPVADGRQRIAINVDYFPRYQPGAELHIHPAMVIEFPRLTDEALRLVSGNKMLLAGAPDIVVNQPIEFAAPKEQHVRWFCTGQDEMERAVVEIHAFIAEWTISLLDLLSDIDGLIESYAKNDARLMKQRHWYIFIAAAFILRGETAAAREVLEEHLGSPGSRQRYEAAFSAVS